MHDEPLYRDDAIDPDDLVDDDEQPSGAPDRRARWWALGGLAAATAFVASVVLSTGSSSIVMADSATSREDVAAFKRAVGPSPARYVVDDRNSGLASMLGAPELGARPSMTRGETSYRTLAHACRNSRRRCATRARGDLRRAVDHPAGDRPRQQPVAGGESRTCSYDR